MREECSRSSLTSKRFSHQGKRGVPRTYLRRKVLKGIEGPSLENRMSIEGSHSGGNEKNRGPKRLPMGCSGSQRGLKERKRELFAGGGPTAGRTLFSLAEVPATGRNPFSLAEAPAAGRTPFLLEVQPDTDKYGCVPIPMPMSPYSIPMPMCPYPGLHARSLNLPPKPDTHIPAPSARICTPDRHLHQPDRHLHQPDRHLHQPDTC